MWCCGVRHVLCRVLCDVWCVRCIVYGVLCGASCVPCVAVCCVGLWRAVTCCGVVHWRGVCGAVLRCVAVQCGWVCCGVFVVCCVCMRFMLRVVLWLPGCALLCVR